MKTKAGAQIEFLHREALGGAKNSLAHPIQLPRTEIAVAIPRRHRDELDIENVPGGQSARFRMINQAGGLRFSFSVKMEPLVFVAFKGNCFPEPIPLKVLS